MYRIYLIGRFINLNDKKSVGGAVKIVNDTAEYFDKIEDFQVIKVDLNSIVNAISKLILKKRGIFLLNISQGGFLYGIPLFYLLSKIHGSKLCLRLIGGDHSDLHRQMSYYKKSLYNSMLKRCDLIFCEVLENYRYFQNLATCEIVPNSRKRRERKTDCLSKKVKRRVVFISQIKKEKGVECYIRANETFKELNIYFDLYGPVYDEDLINGIHKCSHLTYKGVCDYDEVYDIVQEYDFVVLVSSHVGEGYPGILIESFNAGVPILVNDWKFLGELVDDGHNGYLIDDTFQRLKDIYGHISDNLITELSRKAALSFDRYDQCSNYKILQNKLRDVWHID